MRPLFPAALLALAACNLTYDPNSVALAQPDVGATSDASAAALADASSRSDAAAGPADAAAPMGADAAGASPDASSLPGRDDAGCVPTVPTCATEQWECASGDLVDDGCGARLAVSCGCDVGEDCQPQGHVCVAACAQAAAGEWRAPDGGLAMAACPGSSPWQYASGACADGWNPCAAEQAATIAHLGGSSVPPEGGLFWVAEQLGYDLSTIPTCVVSNRIAFDTSANLQAVACFGGSCVDSCRLKYLPVGELTFSVSGAEASLGTLCCRTNGGGCADATAEKSEVFGGDFGADYLYGCAGSVKWAARALLCAPACHVCSAAEWMERSGEADPAANYWTDDDLRYGPAGPSSSDCWASATAGTTCTATDGTPTPMRVCAGGADGYGNTCEWFYCGYGSTSPSESFGGCQPDLTAGALCCCP